MSAQPTDNPDAPGSDPLAFRWYLGGQGSWFASLGLQMVLFPWLAAFVLNVSEAKVGMAQAALMSPALLFMIYGGAFADRRDTRALLIRIHCMAAIPPMVLAVLILGGGLSYFWIIVYALVMGTLSAFAMPARDSLLSNVAVASYGDDIQRAVTLASATQFIGQMIGIALGMLAEISGAPALLGIQAGIMIGGALTVARLAPAPPYERERRHAVFEMREGLGEVARSPVLLPVVICMFAVGVLYVGSFMVLLPLMVRNFYAGNAAEISIVNVCFWGGTILATMGLLRFGHIHKRGLTLACGLASGIVILALMGIPAPFWVMCALCFCWGMGGGHVDDHEPDNRAAGCAAEPPGAGAVDLPAGLCRRRTRRRLRHGFPDPGHGCAHRRSRAGRHHGAGAGHRGDDDEAAWDHLGRRGGTPCLTPPAIWTSGQFSPTLGKTDKMSAQMRIEEQWAGKQRAPRVARRSSTTAYNR